MRMGVGLLVHRLLYFHDNPIELLYHVAHFLFTGCMFVIHLVASVEENLQLFHHPRINITIVPGS